MALGGNECAASSREASGDPLWGRAHSSPALPVDSTAQKPPMCTSALSPPTDERHPRVLTAHTAARQAPTGAAALGSPPGTPRDWRASRPRREVAGSAESPGPGRSGAEGRTLPSYQLRRGSVPPEAPATGMPAPGPPASPAPPACHVFRSQAGGRLDTAWREAGTPPKTRRV